MVETHSGRILYKAIDHAIHYVIWESAFALVFTLAFDFDDLCVLADPNLSVEGHVSVKVATRVLDRNVE